MNKRSRYLLVSLIIGLALLATTIIASGPALAQDNTHPRAEQPAGGPTNPPSEKLLPDAAWLPGPVSPFDLTRFDGAFIPGPEGAAWANKVYFLGGRSGGSTEDPTIWVFDPVTGNYADTGHDMVEDVSNYTANVVPDDGTGRGPGIYVIGGYDADNAVANIGTVQRFYPQTGDVEALPVADNWTPTVAGSLVGASGQAVVGNIIYVFGGWENITAPYFYAGTWAFDPTQASGSRWTNLALNLNPARCYIQVAVQNGNIYAMGGVDFYDGADLAPTTVVEVLDSANLGAGWVTLTPMPVASGEGRGFGFDADTLAPEPWNNHLYVVGGGDWSASSAESMEYFVDTDTWDQAFPDLITNRRDQAGVFIPTCTADPTDGLPGLWVFGGRVDADTPPFGPTEYYPLECAQTRILLVDDDWDFTATVPESVGGRYYYTQTLDTLGFNYDVWDTVSQGSPSAADMSAYSAVIWFTGYAWEDVITPTNETELAAYLDAGGLLLLSSQEYHYASGAVTPFMADYLGIGSIVDDVTELDPVGVAGNPIGDGLGPYSMVRPDLWYAYWPTDTFEGPYDDYAYAGAGAAEPFDFDATGEPNSTNLDGGSFRSVYLAWPFEWIGDLADRQEILARALDWLGFSGQQSVVLIPDYPVVSGLPGTTVDDNFTLINNTPNTDTFTLTVEVNVAWDYTIPANVGPVDPSGGETPFPFSVDIPDIVCPASGVFTVTATSMLSPEVSVSQAVTVRAVCGIGGVVLDATTGEPIQDAYVWAQTDPDGLTGEYYDGFTLPDGRYILEDVAPGTYYMGASAIARQNSFYPDGWPDGAAMVTISGDSVVQDFVLLSSRMGWSPDGWDLILGTGSQYNDTLTISNTGTGPLAFSLDLSDGDQPVPPPPYAGILDLPRIDPQISEDISANGAADFVVVLTGQADLTAADSIRDWNTRGEYVYQTLNGYADQNQTSVRRFLAGNNVDYTPLYIINAVIVHRGDINLVNSLAARDDVAQLVANRKIAVDDISWVEKLLSAPTVPAVVEWNISKVNADDVWALGYNGAGMVVAEIDTGTQWDHPALINHYRGWDGATADHDYNWFDPYAQCPSGGTIPCDSAQHGTHVMGTMVGDDGGANQIGMAPGAKWISCKGGDADSGYLLTNELLQCAQWILAPTDVEGNNPDPSMRPNVVNNSWGGGHGDYWFSGPINAWRAAGIFPAFSNGNAGPACTTAGSPGDNVDSFSSGATDINDAIAGFSSRGPSYLWGFLKPNISAPGVNIRSSIPGSGYQGGWGGTSMASPHTAGAVALVWSAAPDLVGQIDLTGWVLQQSAVHLTTNEGCGGDLPTDVPNNTFGWGRLDALAAVNVALAGVTPDWLTLDTLGGVVEPGESVDVTLNFDVPTTPGIYTATLWLVAYDPASPYVELPIRVEAQDLPPTAGFTSNSPVQIGGTAGFINTTMGSGPMSFLWDFGDGITSTLENPIHTYAAIDVYTVTLTAENSFGEDSVTHLFEVTGIPPQGTFTAPAPITLGDPVTFTVTVTGSGPFEYLWDFGDGTTSTDASPTHLYTAAGTYTVTVTVTSDWGSVTLTDEFVVNEAVETVLQVYLPLAARAPAPTP
jgi:PKD repeat protein